MSPGTDPPLRFREDGSIVLRWAVSLSLLQCERVGAEKGEETRRVYRPSSSCRASSESSARCYETLFGVIEEIRVGGR